MASTLEEVRKAYEGLSDDDKKKFHQSIADRIHESIGEQEEESGTEDSQSAEDREHEALGEEHADGEGEVEELHETDPENGEKDEEYEGEDKDPDVVEEADSEADAEEQKADESAGDPLKEFDARIARLEDAIAKIAGRVNEVAVEDKADEIYGLGNGVFQGEASAEDKKKVTGAEIAAQLRKIR